MKLRATLAIAGTVTTLLLGACSTPEPTNTLESNAPKTTTSAAKSIGSHKPNPTPGALPNGGASIPGESSEGTLNQVTQPESSTSTTQIEAEPQVKADDFGFGEASVSKNSGSSREQRNALIKAKSYLNTMAFSETGLRKQLAFEKFSEPAIDYAMANISVDWNQQAVLKARSYDSTGLGLSDSGLVNQLIFEGFTPEQAQYGVDNM